MRELVKAAFSVMLAGSLSAIRQSASIVFRDDDLGATFDALFLAGDNIQRGAVDVIAGLFGGTDARGLRCGADARRCARSGEETC